jgi:hypothetical protein
MTNDRRGANDISEEEDFPNCHQEKESAAESQIVTELDVQS